MQVADDPELLTQMLQDGKLAPEVYQATNYWQNHEKRLIAELQQAGLHDFRNARPIFDQIGGTDQNGSPARIDIFYGHPLRNRIFDNRTTQKIPLWSKLVSIPNYLLNKMLPVRATYGIRTEDLRLLSYEFVRMLGEKAGAKPLDSFTASLVGNAEVFVTQRDKTYTRRTLNNYLSICLLL